MLKYWAAIVNGPPIASQVPVHPLLATAKPEELAFIAGLDYGQDKDVHLAALESLIFERQGKFKDGELWFPFEVIELGTHSVRPGHEREFTLCCLLALAAIQGGFDPAHDFESRFSAFEPHLGQIPPDLAMILVEAYAADP
jgi:hypothetical protein